MYQTLWSLGPENTVCHAAHRLESQLRFCVLSNAALIVLPMPSLCSDLPSPKLLE